LAPAKNKIKKEITCHHRSRNKKLRKEKSITALARNHPKMETGTQLLNLK